MTDNVLMTDNVFGEIFKEAGVSGSGQVCVKIFEHLVRQLVSQKEKEHCPRAMKEHCPRMMEKKNSKIGKKSVQKL